MPGSKFSMRALFIASCIALFAASKAAAADLVVSLKSPAGAPVADVVVLATPAGGAPKAQIKFPWAYRMAQKNMTFVPFILIVPVGAEVSFPNLDPVLHHVYSFSPVKPFELKLYGKDESRFVRFDRVGTISVGCNIHDDMTGFIRVVDTPFAGKSNAAGEVTLTGLPEGAVTLTVWHPYLKAPRGELSRSLTLRPGVAREAVTVDLRAAPMKHGGY